MSNHVLRISFLDQLPAGFSQKLQDEETKLKPRFDARLQEVSVSAAKPDPVSVPQPLPHRSTEVRNLAINIIRNVQQSDNFYLFLKYLV